MNMNFVQ